MAKKELNELSTCEYLRNLAERLRKIPVMYGCDDYDIDMLEHLAGQLAPGIGRGRGESDPKQLLEQLSRTCSQVLLNLNRVIEKRGNKSDPLLIESRELILQAKDHLG